ncbi:LysR substrate-binding domain-containing protein [Mucilaginibacter sp. P25]|jgi:LysR family hydrogen peroxide-inducible transcriptional activator|uniref:LysR family transcriptional regulator n=2 Tax=Mucilaginibacter TaxID=423349 RepID=A0AAE6JI06_9SPHI|nr:MULTISPECIES: hydrogen peroxide-inducible genes activator [Mucilaginibacter]NVM64115.1 LysR family hydrogen peroxide-inducible transcriptional activator [Mucilaginibacter sp. SG538B]QEM06054.1 LysR family transcriptional regulator [Mucilaginibacter rubeus]QEM18635.1 LysR family transcriptional regulator [Mucilaginibacter gossypii]QTE44823.1 LysR family transcriptional regulator [Mucilaginibacter rubeus]QTE51421.1 LysR family transcriptional regulator [Mucilaginibacter rubeus]
MTITQLEYIVAVDTYRSFVLAAEKCFVTQPTLSMQVQKLEDTLGVKIFDRSKQPVVPTEIGIEIITQARVMLSESEKIKEIISDRQKELSGELRVGIIPTVSPYILPKIIHGFIEKYPQVKLIVWEQTTEEIIQQLKLGMLDCGILSTPLHENNLTEIPVFYENFVAYVSKNSKLSKKKNIVPDDIDMEEIWILNEGHCMREQVLNICQRRKSTRGFQHFEYNTGSVETLKRMVDQNNGATILPELALSELSEKQLDKVRYFKSPEPAREVSIVIQRNFLKRRMIEALKAEILEFVPKRMKSKKKKEVMDI